MIAVESPPLGQIWTPTTGSSVLQKCRTAQLVYYNSSISHMQSVLNTFLLDRAELPALYSPIQMPGEAKPSFARAAPVVAVRVELCRSAAHTMVQPPIQGS